METLKVTKNNFNVDYLKYEPKYIFSNVTIKSF